MRDTKRNTNSPTNWLEKELCPAAGCAIENVFLIPGNHDVDVKAETGPASMHARKSLRATTADKVDDELRNWLRDPGSANIIFKPIEDYGSPFICRLMARSPLISTDFAPQPVVHLFEMGIERSQVSLGMIDRWCDRAWKLVSKYLVPNIDELDEAGRNNHGSLVRRATSCRGRYRSYCGNAASARRGMSVPLLEYW